MVKIISTKLNFSYKLSAVIKHIARSVTMYVSEVCFILRHINLIGHSMLNQVKENKPEKKFKGEVLGIKDKL